ncbi:MAG TPA: hypothetical protein VGY56_08175 [Verrucomicrobiae bacterium]|nr:hypothetical protein [Verrucomicrobiae bacterium]
MEMSIRQATTQDTGKVAKILREAAQWLEANGKAMWRDDELMSTPDCSLLPSVTAKSQAS